MATELTNSEIIFQACITLRNEGRQINRRILSKVTGLKLIVVDDHVTRMEEQHGKLRRLQGGFIEVVEQFPANRPISKTVLPDGSVTIEVGDHVVQLTPGEAQVLGGNLIGEATIFAQLRGDRDVSDRVARLERQRSEDKAKIEAQAKLIARLQHRGQPELFDA